MIFKPGSRMSSWRRVGTGKHLDNRTDPIVLHCPEIRPVEARKMPLFWECAPSLTPEL
jgi:hypothetical protein